MTERVSVEYEVVAQGSTYLGVAHPLSDGGLAVYVRDVTDAERRERERDELFAALRRASRASRRSSRRRRSPCR